jgi:splicing factor 3A subunit 1
MITDPEEQGIIDKFATYVAKHGVDFERVTHEKQKSNPKFAFLVPGNPKYDYYKYKLNSLLRPGM